MSRNILIVGGAGYIGGALTDRLIDYKEYNIRVYDNLLYEESYRKNVDFVFGDIRDHNLLKNHLGWADTVVWLAALVGDGACAINPELTMELNQLSVKWLSENFDGRIIYTSTCSVYGAQQDIIDETSLVNPLSTYAITKYNAESYLKNKNAIIFRLGTLFGVGDQFSRIRLDLVLNILVVKASVENKLSVFGGEQYRPLLHVKDVAKTIVENLDTEYTGIYNLKRDNMKILDIAQKVQNHFPNSELVVTDISFEDARNYRVKSDKAENEINFKALRTIDDGILELKELIENKRLRDLNNFRYSNQLYLSKNINNLI